MSDLVYVVTSGEYSGYGIRAVFSTEDKAQAYIARARARAPRWDDESMRIEYYVLDEQNDAFGPWSVHMTREGKASMVHRASIAGGTERWGGTKQRPAIVYFTVWARSEEQAIKAANERRLQMIAEGEWS